VLVNGQLNNLGEIKLRRFDYLRLFDHVRERTFIFIY
jgi:hypothetical protein